MELKHLQNRPRCEEEVLAFNLLLCFGLKILSHLFTKKADKIHFKIRHMIIHQNIHLFTASTAGEDMVMGLHYKHSMHFPFKIVVKIAFWNFFYI